MVVWWCYYSLRLVTFGHAMEQSAVLCMANQASSLPEFGWYKYIFAGAAGGVARLMIVLYTGWDAGEVVEKARQIHYCTYLVAR